MWWLMSHNTVIHVTPWVKRYCTSIVMKSCRLLPPSGDCFSWLQLRTSAAWYQMRLSWAKSKVFDWLFDSAGLRCSVLHNSFRRLDFLNFFFNQCCVCFYAPGVLIFHLQKKPHGNPGTMGVHGAMNGGKKKVRKQTSLTIRIVSPSLGDR